MTLCCSSATMVRSSRNGRLSREIRSHNVVLFTGDVGLNTYLMTRTGQSCFALFICSAKWCDCGAVKSTGSVLLSPERFAAYRLDQFLMLRFKPCLSTLEFRPCFRD